MKVQVPGGDFAVRGLGLADVLSLARVHAPALKKMFDAYDGDPQSIMLDVLVSAPALVDEIIKAASDGEAGKPLVLSVQIAALEKIAELTFVGEGALGNTIAVVNRAISAANGLTSTAG